MEKILKDVLRKITPTDKERQEIQETYKEISAVLEKTVKKRSLSFVLAGSFSRDTWLPNKKEFDVFVLFPDSYPREKLEKDGLELGKEIMKILGGTAIVKYAEHPYTRGQFKGYDMDIVPCYAVGDASKIKSAVDRTPFHNKYIEKNLAKGLAGEVRLLKQFSKGIGIYGSDTKTQGFSGYLCELLIIHYRSFKNFIMHASKWEPGEVFIDLEKHHPRPEESKLIKRFRGQALIVIDPVDPHRNVAAAFSAENFLRLVTSARAFIKKPEESFFFRHPHAVDKARLKEEIRKRKSRLMLLEFQRPDVIDDVLWPQMRKAGKRIRESLEDAEFDVMGMDVHCSEHPGKCILLFEMEVWDLPKIRILEGPEVFAKNRAREFIKKYRSRGRIWIERDRYMAEIERKYLKANAALKGFIMGSGQDLKAKGVPSYVADSLAKGFLVIDSDEKMLSRAGDAEVGLLLWNYLKKKLMV